MILEILDILTGIFANAFRIYTIKRFVNVFFDKKDYTWNVQNLLYVIFCLETSLIYNLFHLPALNVLSNVAGLMLVIFPYRTKFSHKILAVFLIYSVNVIVDSFVVFFFTQYQMGDKVNQLYECITSLILWLIVFLFEKTLDVEKEKKLPLAYQAALGAVPVVSITVLYFVIQSAWEMKAVILCVTAGFFLTNILIFYLYASLNAYYSAYAEKKMYEQMAAAYAHQLELVQESQNRVKSLRHDLKHHIIELKTLSRKGSSQELENYLDEMGVFMLNPNEYVATGNPNIDGILNYLLIRANEVLKIVEVQVIIPEHLSFNHFHLCVILGNLLDNAIRAARQTDEKYLNVNIQTKKGVLFLFIENSYSGNIVEIDHKIVSSQKNMEIHGIGLENVRKIVEINCGDMKINYMGGRFEVEILLYPSAESK